MIPVPLNPAPGQAAHNLPAVQGQQSPLWQIVIATILSLLVSAGVGAGLTIIIFALSASYNITIYLTGVACILLLITFGISLFGTTGSVKRAFAINVFLIFSGLLLLFAFYPGLRPAGPRTVLVVLGVVIIAGIGLAWFKPAWMGWLGDITEPKKAFGGTTFVELASFIGVIGAIGSHSGLSGDTEGWFWMGHFGTLLAFAAGGSLFWRWLRFNDDVVPAYLGLVLVFATLFSLAMSPTLVNWFIFGVWTVLILTAVIMMIKTAYQASDIRLNNLWANPTPIQGTHRFFLIAMTVIITAAGIAYLVLTALSLFSIPFDTPTIVGIVFTTIALLCWVGSEFWNVIVKRKKSWNKALNYQEWEKNIWNIFGGITLIFFTLARLWTSSPLPIENNYIFLLGIAFGMLGTLRGILVGIIKKYG